MLRVLIIIGCLAFAGSAWAEENWQLKYEQLAKQHVQLLEESIKLKTLVTQLSAAVTRQELIDRKNSAAVLSAELKQIDESKKPKDAKPINGSKGGQR